MTISEALNATETLSDPWAPPIAFAGGVLELSAAARMTKSANALTSREMSPPQAQEEAWAEGRAEDGKDVH